MPRSRNEFVCIILLSATGVGLLATEYRLNVPGLAFSITAMLLAGIARALQQFMARFHPDVLSDNAIPNIRSIAVAATVGMAWVLIFWTEYPVFALDIGSLPLQAVHGLTSALALSLGQSIFLPFDDRISGTDFRHDRARGRYACDAISVAILTSTLGCISSLSSRRSYTNIYQFFCFLIALLFISSRAYVGPIDASSRRPRFASSAYELVDSLSTPSAEGRGAIDPARASHSSVWVLWFRSQTTRVLNRWLLGLGVTLLWTTYMGFNFTERPHSPRPIVLNREYAPNRSVEIVLSMYKEPVDEVKKLLYNLKSVPGLSDALSTIYLKSNETETSTIRQKTGADRVIALPNIGREGETFLNHILHQWDSLARQTVFLQADIHNPREFYPRITNYYSRDQTGFLNLGFSGVVCNCADCGDRHSWQDNKRLFPEIYSRIDHSNSCDHVLLSYKSQFIVSAARIRGISRDIYQSTLR